MFALGTGFACAVVSGNYVQVVAPPFAAILGVFVLYPVMVVGGGTSIDPEAGAADDCE